MISEEFPDARRGRAIAALHMVAFLGVTAAALTYAIMAESRWGWRGMYLLGIAPLVMVFFLRRGLRETARFNALERARIAAGRARPEFWTSIRNCLTPLAGPYRSRLLMMAGLWNSIGLIGGPTVTYFPPLRQTRSSLEIPPDRRGDNSRLRDGHYRQHAERIPDGPARAKVHHQFFLPDVGAAMYLLFTSDTYGAILAGEVLTMFAYQAARTATSALSTELFPTAIRATGYNLCVQVIGQICWMLSPVVIGLLSAPLGGLGNAASIFAAGPMLGVVMVVWFVPETRGRTLEELSPSVEDAADNDRVTYDSSAAHDLIDDGFWSRCDIDDDRVARLLERVELALQQVRIHEMSRRDCAAVRRSSPSIPSDRRSSPPSDPPRSRRGKIA